MDSNIPVAIKPSVDSPHPKMPTRGSKKAAGWDLYAADSKIVPAQGKAIVPTGLYIAIPDGYYGRIAPRSGMSWKNHTDIGAGVIDSDYRGEIGIVIFNHADQDLEINMHDRVAQLVIEKINTNLLKQVKFDELDDTLRGADGFGSTGIGEQLS